MSRLLVVGSINADLVIGVHRRPAAGETVLGSDLATYPGGKGANQAVAAARLGADAGFLGRVGTDAHGGFLRAALTSAGVEAALIETPGASGVALITVEPGGENTIIVSPGANAHFSPADVAAARPMFGRAAVVSTQLEIPLPAVAAAMNMAAACGARAVLNPSPPVELPAEILSLCDPLILNEPEASFLLGGSGPVADQAKALLALGPRSVVVTLGAAGAYAADGETVEMIPSPPTTAVDTTGAGDAFAGALGRCLAHGDTLIDATRFAARVGAAAVRGHGAQSSYPTLADL